MINFFDNPKNNPTMNKYRVIITEPNGKELFNKVYEVPVQSGVINYLTGDQDFLYDLLQESSIGINDPNLKWDIYFESPLEFEQDKLIKEIQQELIYNNFDTEHLKETLYELLDDIGLQYTHTNKMPEELKAYLIKHLQNEL